MDTALNVNGDFDKDDDGRAYRINGKNEIRQKIYMLLAAKRGSFIYDRELGSEIYTVDIQADNYIELIEAKARKALERLPKAEVIGVAAENCEICISVEYDGDVYDIKLYN